MNTRMDAQRAFAAYHETLQQLHIQGVTHEQGLRRAFGALLEATAKPHGWLLVEETPLKGSRSRPDGTLYDSDKFPRGYWEAKDTKDDLEDEVRKKINKGYDLKNTIFEDTRRGILYQNGQRVYQADLTKPHDLSELLAKFYDHTTAQIEQFHTAVKTFQTDIPTLAAGLLKQIEEERTGNPTFIAAFNDFHELCKTSLNPNISLTALEEMLAQHLLTERLFRTVFDNAEFIRHNVIAAEIETVIAALTSRSFSRGEYLKKLDYFYTAIEDAAKTITDYGEKQGFLNTIYERFFQGFSKAQADTHGIVYTPQEIVDFMCASVEEVLKIEFRQSLSTPGVKILDPATGTGNFLVNILRRINPLELTRKYDHDLFANEVMLLPYYIAAMNIEHAYYEKMGQYRPFPGLCFADTLDLAEAKQLSFLFTPKNTERVERERKAEITVIIGNPPYNVGQVNENDNNKNRKYPVIDKRIRDTYAADSRATNKNALSDAYVKFFRWATDRLDGRAGIICYVTNNSFLDQVAFDGMRKHLLADFNQIYHIDLHGNVRKNPKLSGTSHNVFGIQVGVGITLAVRNSQTPERFIKYLRVPEDWRKTEKWAYLAEHKDIRGIPWEELTPNAKHSWLTAGLEDAFDTFLPMGSKETKAAANSDVHAIFKMYGGGVKTNRDDWAYDFDRQALTDKIRRFIDNYNAEVERWKTTKPKPKIDDFVSYDDTKYKWSETLKSHVQRGTRIEYSEEKVRYALYRPFCRQYLYFDGAINERVYQLPAIFPKKENEEQNLGIWLKVGSEVPAFALATNIIPDLMPQGGSQLFPLYTYTLNGAIRHDNITDWALKQFKETYGDPVTKRDIFHYVYGLLHSPAYRTRYAENLKRDLPRIPLAATRADYEAFKDAGERLATLHLTYESAPEYPLTAKQTPGEALSWRVTKMRLSPDKTELTINPTLTLSGIPPEAFSYKLGNRSALKWVVDQYQVKTDARSGLTSDPNRADDPEYIVRLVRRVVTVSLETTKIVAGLPELTPV